MAKQSGTPAGPPRPAPFVGPEGESLRDLLPKKMPTDKVRKERLAKVLARLEKRPGEWDAKLIKEMRLLGMGRPSWIPEDEWNVKDERYSMPLRSIAYYQAAWGMQPHEIAKSIGASAEWVKEAITSEEGVAAIKEIQFKIWGKDPKKWIESILPSAIQTAFEIMNDKTAKASTRLAAAEQFIDRAMGKATQVIETHDSTVRRMIEMMDAFGAAKPVVATQDESMETDHEEPELPTLPVPAEAPKDVVDRWVEENF